MAIFSDDTIYPSISIIYSHMDAEYCAAYKGGARDYENVRDLVGRGQSPVDAREDLFAKRRERESKIRAASEAKTLLDSQPVPDDALTYPG